MAMITSSEKFNILSEKIAQLFCGCGRRETDRQLIAKSLEELNILNYRYNIVTNPTKAALLINQLSSFVPTDDELLVSKCCRLITNLIKYQNVSIEGRTLTIVVKWCLHGLKNMEKLVQLDIFRTLEVLLRSLTPPSNLIVDVVKEVKVMLEPVAQEIEHEMLLAALKCLEACVSHEVQACHEQELFYFGVCADIFVSHLKIKQTPGSLIHTQILEVCLTGLQSIVVHHPKYLERELGILLGIVKSYFLYGVKGFNFLEVQKILPSPLSIPEVQNGVQRKKKAGKVTKHRKAQIAGTVHRKNKEDSDNFGRAPTNLNINSDSKFLQFSSTQLNSKTSDSDFSDSDAGRLAKLKHWNGRVRLSALNLFFNIIKHTEKSTIFCYWLCFLPEESKTGIHNLYNCILRDPLCRCRLAALNVLLLILTSSKMYLPKAECSTKSTSYTPFSVSLGLSLTALHRVLCLALNDVLATILTQTLKCVAALVQSTPYQKMGPGLITKLTRNVKLLVFHKDVAVQVTALIVMGCLLASEPVISETVQCVTRIPKEEEEEASSDVKNDQITNTEDGLDSDDFDFAEFPSDEYERDPHNKASPLPWLLKKCLSNLEVSIYSEQQSSSSDVLNKSIPAPIKIESLQIISAMCQNNFEQLLLPHLEIVTAAIEKSLTDKYVDVRLHAARAVEFLGETMDKIMSTDSSHKILNLEQCLAFWETLLSDALICVLQDEQNATVRATGCDCLGSIGPHVYQHLPRAKQLLCITLLFACTKHEDDYIRGAAIRSLAIYVWYPSLTVDLGFVIDTVEAILNAIRDKNIAVRIKASWSLGNLSDALVQTCPQTDSLELSESFPDDMLLKVLKVSISTAEDNDRIRMNVMRATGNFLQLVDAAILKRTEFKNICEQAILILIKNCTTGNKMKVRWNACYALASTLKNNAFYEETDTSKWQPLAFNSLMKLVIDFKNLKVRINAAAALASPTRAQYGQFYHPVWVALLKALENTQNIDDFNEYQHRDHLIEQICLALGHLTVLLVRSDLAQLEESLVLYLEILKEHMRKVLERLIPEKSTELFSASCFLDKLASEDMSTSERNVLEKLQNVFKTGMNLNTR